MQDIYYVRISLEPDIEEIIGWPNCRVVSPAEMNALNELYYYQL